MTPHFVNEGADVFYVTDARKEEAFMCDSEEDATFAVALLNHMFKKFATFTNVDFANKMVKEGLEIGWEAV